MKKLITIENPFVLANIKATLEQEGIPCFIKNEFVGGASGELPHFELWPEIWVINEEQHTEAYSLVESINQKSLDDSWICAACKEPNGEAFASCWNCQQSPKAK